MENKEREMEFEVDSDVQAVLEFMQTNIHAAKLVGVAESAAQMGRLLWGRYPQEPFVPLSLCANLPSSISGVRLPTSTECARAQERVDGDSVVAGCCSGQ